MSADDTRKYLLIFSGMSICYQCFGLVNDGTIPYTQVKVPSPANVFTILTFLITFLCVQYLYYWFIQKKEERLLFDLFTAVSIALVAITPVIYTYLKQFGIDWKVILTTTIILICGGFLAIAVDFTISILFSLRNKFEMETLGLDRIPSASKAFIRCLCLLFPICMTIFVLLAKFNHFLPTPLNDYWVVVFIAPAIACNFSNITNLFLCLGPSKVRGKALSYLKKFRRAMDLHEMRYQYIGIEQHKTHDIPKICQFSIDGQVAEVKKLLDECVDPNTQDARGWTSLMYAAAERHLEILMLLLDHGADPNIINYLGRTAIMYASNYGYYEIVKELLVKGAAPNVPREFTGHPPLSAVANNGHIEVVKLLVEHGADVMHKNRDNQTALDIAMEAGHSEVAKYLRNKILSLDTTPIENRTNLLKN